MRITIYYLVLLVLITLITGFLFQSNTDAMSMGQMISVSILLGVYVVAMSLVGEGRATDERQMQHRYTANRLGLIAGTIVLSIGVLIQLFHHKLDYWLLGSLIAINFVKIVSLIYSNYKN